MKSILVILGLYVFAMPFGYLLDIVGVPLSWMIGPMLSTAFLVSTGMVRQKVPTSTRPVGQIVVATFVGAHFSPEAFHALRQTAPLLVSVSLFTLGGALLVARLQMRVFSTDPVTAVLSTVPTSPVEAGILAETYGVPPTPVIFSQTIRIAMVVLLVPFALFAANGFETHQPPPAQSIEAAAGALWIMVGGAVLGVTVFKTLRLTNPFFLGPLFASSALAALGLQSFVIPDQVLWAAQLILGTWLGACFRPDLLRSGRQLVGSVLMTSFLLLVLCGAGSVLFSRFVEVPVSTLLLGAAPGGATEMALTAGILGLDVALVTAIHLTRIFIIMPSLSWIAKTQHKSASR